MNQYIERPVVNGSLVAVSFALLVCFFFNSSPFKLNIDNEIEQLTLKSFMSITIFSWNIESYLQNMIVLS